MDAIILWLQESYPALFLVLILLVIGGVAVWCFTQFRSKIIETIDERFDGLQEDVTIIKSFLISTHPKAANIFSMKKSPRRLNSNGERLYNILNGEQFLKENLDILMKKLSVKNLLTELDVEMGASEVLYESIDEPLLSPIKKIIYNSPSIDIEGSDGAVRSYELSLNDAIFVLSLALRDMYLEEHPEIAKEE